MEGMYSVSAAVAIGVAHFMPLLLVHMISIMYITSLFSYMSNGASVYAGIQSYWMIFPRATKTVLVS